MDIITGATGIIGSAMARQLKNACCVVRPSSERINNLPENANILWCDLRDIWMMDLKTNIDTCYHLAWFGTDRESRLDTFRQFSNIGFTLNTIQTAHKHGCKTFVFAGSQAEYGRKDCHIWEETLCEPDTAYGAAKLAAGHLGRLLCKKLGIKFIHARIFSAYGPNDSPNTMLMYLINALKRKEKPVLSSCEQDWNFMHCDDVARALIHLAENGEDGQIYNIASEENKPLIEYVTEAALSTIDIGIGEKKGEVINLIPEISKLRSSGFIPQIKFRDGVRELTK